MKKFLNKQISIKNLLLAGIVVTISVSSLGAFPINIKATVAPHVSVKYNSIVHELKNSAGATIYPINYNDTIYLPLRAVSGILDVPVEWDEDTETIYLGETDVTDATSSTVSIPVSVYNADSQQLSESNVTSQQFLELNVSTQQLSEVTSSLASNQIKPIYYDTDAATYEDRSNNNNKTAITNNHTSFEKDYSRLKGISGETRTVPINGGINGIEKYIDRTMDVATIPAPVPNNASNSVTKTYGGQNGSEVFTMTSRLRSDGVWSSVNEAVRQKDGTTSLTDLMAYGKWDYTMKVTDPAVLNVDTVNGKVQYDKAILIRNTSELQPYLKWHETFRVSTSNKYDTLKFTALSNKDVNLIVYGDEEIMTIQKLTAKTPVEIAINIQSISKMGFGYIAIDDPIVDVAIMNPLAW